MSGDFCHPLIVFANNLDPDQARLFDRLMVFREECLERKDKDDRKKHTLSLAKYPACIELRNTVK